MYDIYINIMYMLLHNCIHIVDDTNRDNTLFIGVKRGYMITTKSVFPHMDFSNYGKQALQSFFGSN